jgi:hypothetical protein
MILGLLKLDVCGVAYLLIREFFLDTCQGVYLLQDECFLAGKLCLQVSAIGATLLEILKLADIGLCAGWRED